MRRKFSTATIVLSLAAVSVALSAACGGGSPAATAAAPTLAPPGAGPVMTGVGTGGQSLVPGSNVFALATSTPTPPSGTPTSTPPALTLSEEQTSVLVDNLSVQEFPRIPARDLEATFRNEPDKVPGLLGKSFLIQGDVRDAGRDGAGKPYVTFKAGAGAVTCHFEKISEAELLRMTPDGRNAVTGKAASWDPVQRLLMVEGCRLVRGY